jgi:hypothetical protein
LVATISTAGATGLRRGRFFFIFVLAGISLFGAAPARAALPGGYVATAVDDPSTPIAASTTDSFGDNFANAGDVNGDGKDDLIVGVPRAPDQNSLPGISGKVVFVSGLTGGVISTVAPPSEPSHTGALPTQFGARVATLGDIGSCPTPGCGSSILAPDGIPEHLVSSSGADISSSAPDMGNVYVLDGKTNGVMKKMELAADDFPASGTPGFGKALAVPMGEPPCQSYGGIGACPYASSSPVTLGDLDGGGKPDIIVGAPDYSETADSDPAGCPLSLGSCPALGRVYVFRGEDIAGSANTPLDQPLITMRYSDTATASQRPRLGASIAPLGDVGACVLGPLFVGSSCLPGTPDVTPTSAPDGFPDFLVGAPGLDGGGAAFVAEGQHALPIAKLPAPDPEQDAGFALFASTPPAPGDLGGSPVPDVFAGAPGLDVGSTADQGRAYVLNGDLAAPVDQYRLATFDDPLPGSGAKFGTSAVGIGDVAGDSPGEVAVGRGGGPVQIFSPGSGALLQTIPDPDPGTGFGSAIAPLGDLNGDGYLDFAIGAPGKAGGQGRVYLMKSCPSLEGCAPPTGGGGAGGAGGSGTTTNPPSSTPKKRTTRKKAPGVRALVKRKLTLKTPKKSVTVGSLATFKGRLRAKTRSCRFRQKVAIQRLTPQKVWLTINVGITRRDGTFASSTRPAPAQALYYRARVTQTKRCMTAVSKRLKIVARNAGT